MKRALLAMTLIWPGAGCVNAVSQGAICDATRQDRTDLAAALVADGGDRSVVAGQRLISRLDAGCSETGKD